MSESIKALNTVAVAILISFMFCSTAIPMGVIASMDEATTDPSIDILGADMEPPGSPSITSPIRIDGNADLVSKAATYGWSGNGSSNNPFIIDGVNFDAHEAYFGLYVGNTTLSLTISNCGISSTVFLSDPYRSGSAILLFNVSSAKVLSSSFSSTYRGVSIIGSNDIDVNNTSFYSPTNGIHVVDSNNITLNGNQIYGAYGTGIYVTGSESMIITANQIQGSDMDGIYLSNSFNNTIDGNTVYGSSHAGLESAASDSNEIKNNQFTGGSYGVLITNANSLQIHNNSISSDYGIHVTSLLDSNISANHISYGYITLYMATSSSNLMEENEIRASSYGIYLATSQDMMLSANVINDCSEAGIFLSDSGENTFHSNVLHGCSFLLIGDVGTFVNQTIPTNNTVNGAPVYHYHDTDMDNASVPLDAGQVIVGKVQNLILAGLNLSEQTTGLVIGYSEHIRVENSTFYRDSPYGISTFLTQDLVIRNDTFLDCEYGIYSASSSGPIYDNTLSSCDNGIYFDQSDHNLVRNNTISDSTFFGIRMYYAYYNEFYNNTMTGSSFDMQGDSSSFTTQTIPTNNTVNGRPVYYYHDTDMDNASVPLDAGQVIFGNVLYGIVRELNLSDQNVGLLIGYSTHIIVENNTFENDSPNGIHTYETSDSTFANNTFLECERGAWIERSNDNTLVNNNASGCDEGLSLSNSNGCTIRENRLSAQYGVSLTFSNDVLISENLFLESFRGLYVYESDLNIISENIFEGIGNYAIELSSSSSNSIQLNAFNDTSTALYGYQSDTNQISDNRVNNSYFGVYLRYSDGNNVTTNNITGTQKGIYLDSSYSDIFLNDISGCYDGISVINVNGFLLRDNDLTECYNAIVFQNCQSFTVKNNTLTDSHNGIFTYYCTAGILLGNNISSCYEGIRSYYSSSMQVRGNTVDNCSVGIEVYSGSGNVVKDNRIDNSSQAGIMLSNTYTNALSGNEMVKSSIDIHGNAGQFSSQTIGITNTVNGKPVYYYKSVDMSSTTVPSDAGQIILSSVTNALIGNMDLSDQNVGLLIGYSSFVWVEGNTFDMDKTGGVRSYGSNNCTVIDNVFNDCRDGVLLETSKYMSISSNEINGCEDGIHQYGTSTNNLIRYNEIENCSNAINLYSSYGSTVEFNNITSSEIGVQVENSNEALVQGNRILDSGLAGINLLYSTVNEVQGNLIDNCTYGIEVTSSSSNLILQNRIGNSSRAGIFSNASENNVFNYNALSECLEGIGLIGSSQDHIEHNEIVECVVGIVLMTCIGELLDQNTISDSGDIGIKIIGSEDIEVYHNTIQRSASYGLLTNTSLYGSISLNRFIDNNGAGDVYDPDHIQAFDDCYVYVDTTAPTFPNLWPFNGYITSNDQIQFSWNIFEDGIGLESSGIRIGEGEWVDTSFNDNGNGWYTADYQFNSLEEGSYQVDIRAVDKYGNEGTITTAFTVDLDYDGPLFDGWWPSNGELISAEHIDVGWYFYDLGNHEIISTLVRMDGGEWQEPDYYNDYGGYYEAGFEFSPVEDGAHLLEIFANDSAGFEITLSITVTFEYEGGVGVPAPTGLGGMPEIGSTSWSMDGIGNYWSDWLSPDLTYDGIVDLQYVIDGGNVTDEYPLAHMIAIPADLSADPFPNNVDLYWNGYNYSVTGSIDGYYLVRNSTYGDDFNVTLDEGATSYTDPTVLPFHHYNYTLVAFSGDIIGGMSRVIHVITPDPDPPLIEITSPAEGTIEADDSVTMTWEGTKVWSDIVSYSVRLNDGEWNVVGLNTSHTFADIPDGSNDLWVKVFSAAGNINEAHVGITVDTTPPIVSIITPEEGQYLNVSHIEAGWTVYDEVTGLDHCLIGLNGGDWVNVSSDLFWNSSHLEDGEYTLVVKAFDLVGNNGSAMVNFTIDTTGPIVRIDSPSDGDALGSSSVTVTWSGSDVLSDIAGYSYRIDDDVWSANSSEVSHVFSGLSDGQHIVWVKAFDVLGNSADTSVTFKVDTIAPTISIISPSPGLYFNLTSMDVEAEASDLTSGISGYQYRLDDGSWSAMTQTEHDRFVGLSDGSHTVQVKAFDQAGNFGLAEIGFTIDTTSPTVSITSPATDQRLRSADILVQWSSAGTGSPLMKTEVSIDGGIWTTLAASTTEKGFTSLSEGQHTISVRVTDSAGNVGTASAVFSMDTVAPTATERTPNGTKVNITAIIVVTFSEAMNASSVVLTGVAGTMSWAGNTVTLAPTSTFSYGRTYAMTVGGSDLAGNEMTSTWEFTTKGNGTITGRILDSSGNAMANMTVRLNTGEIAVTDGNGTFIFNVNPGNYTLSVIKDGAVIEEMAVGVTSDDLSDVGSIEVASGPGTDWSTLLIVVFVALSALVLVIIFVRRLKKD